MKRETYLTSSNDRDGFPRHPALGFHDRFVTEIDSQRHGFVMA